MKDTERYPFGETSDNDFPFAEVSDNDFPFTELSDDESPFGRYQGEVTPFDSDREEANPFGFVMDRYQGGTDEKPEVTSKVVFDLRKAGKLDEAYTKALQLMEQPNLSDWDIKAYGYVLMSLIKRDVERGHDDQISTYVCALRNLQVEDDEVFENNKNKSLRLCDRGYQQIERLVKAKRYKEAAPLARDAYKADRSNENMERLYCQILFNVVKEEAQKPKPKARPVKGYVDAYFGLPGRSRAFYDKHIWNHISKLEDEQGDLNVGQYYLATMEEELPKEAYSNVPMETYNFVMVKEEHTNKPRYRSSMFGKMARYVLEHILTSKDISLMQQICHSVESKERELNEDEVWVIRWKRGKVLQACGEYEKARECILQTIESKSREFWVWSALGDTYVEEDSLTDLRILSCYSMALWCNPQLKLGASLKLKFVEKLLKQENYEEASIEVAELLANPTEVGKKNYEEAQRLSQASWYVDSPSKTSNRELYKLLRGFILAELGNTLQMVTGQMMSSFTHDQQKFYKIAFALDFKKPPSEVTLTKRDLQGVVFEPGQFVRAKLEWTKDSKGRDRARAVIMCETKPKENFLPTEYGLVTYINREKDVAHITTTKYKEVFLQKASEYHLEELMAVSFTCTEYKDSKNRTKLSVYDVAPADDVEVKKLKVDIIGTFEEGEGNYGFLQDVDCIESDSSTEICNENVYVDAKLIKDHKLVDETVVKGIAVSSYNSKRGSWGWKLATITNVEYGDGEVYDEIEVAFDANKPDETP